MAEVVSIVVVHDGADHEVQFRTGFPPWAVE
eukprot:COSAG02_NODE_29641_length_565_cov_1.757511_1_plen_30_part_01